MLWADQIGVVPPPNSNKKLRVLQNFSLIMPLF